MSQEPGWGLVEEGLGLGPPAHGHSLPRTPFLDHDSHREPVNGLVSSSPSQLQFGLTLAPLSCSLPPTERTYLPGMLNINGTVEKPTSTSAQKANRDAVSFFQEDQQHHSVAQTSPLPSLTKLQRLDFRKKMDFANDCLKLLNFQSGFLLHKYQPPPTLEYFSLWSWMPFLGHTCILLQAGCSSGAPLVSLGVTLLRV